MPNSRPHRCLQVFFKPSNTAVVAHGVAASHCIDGSAQQVISPWYAQTVTQPKRILLNLRSLTWNPATHHHQTRQS